MRNDSTSHCDCDSPIPDYNLAMCFAVASQGRAPTVNIFKQLTLRDWANVLHSKIRSDDKGCYVGFSTS